MGIIWKNTGSRVWLIVTSFLCILMLLIGILSTQVSLFFGTLNLVFGGYRYAKSDVEPTIYYQSQYSSKEESVAAISELTERIAGEGIVLLKNDNVSGGGKALPLSSQMKVSVFGKNSVNMVYGGSGSGGRSADGVVNLYDALKSVGLDYNPALKDFYSDNSRSGSGRDKHPIMGTILAGFAVGETPVKNSQGALTSGYSELSSTYAGYNDAAIIVISRIGGEGYDLPRSMKSSFGSNATITSGAHSMDDHYLQLDKNETDLIEHVCNNFDRVIILINSGTSMELDFLTTELYWGQLGYNDFSSKIQAALWIGNPGQNGNAALAKILTGEINPSGRTVNTFATDFKKDPTWNNFGNNLYEDGNKYFINSWGSTAVNAGGYFVRYEEGIYMGYRYYETRYASLLPDQQKANEWYQDNVVYPFGYGLSYTSFSWAIESQTPSMEKDGTISVTVNVTNTSTVAGRDVVQLYYTSPYYSGGIEKAHVVLGDFAKTSIIEPGASESVTVNIKVSDMASYDWSDANNNGFKGYELDPGNYIIRLSRNSHVTEHEIMYTLLTNIQYDVDPVTGYPVVNRFDKVSDHIANTSRYLSRNDWEGTWPRNPVNLSSLRNSYNVLQAGPETNNFLSELRNHNVTSNYDTGKPWYTSEMPLYGQRGELMLSDLVGLDYDNEKWDLLLNQLTIQEMAQLIGVGAFNTVNLPSIGKPPTKEYDGPAGFVIGSFMSIGGNDTEVAFYPCQSLIGATWSKELARLMGEAIGEEGLWGAVIDGTQFTFSGWYAPGVNIHRSPFSGRNFEYYSEDGLLSGKLAAEVCAGALSKGVYTFIKHFAVNDQEMHRSANGLVTWLDEQAMREIYLKPFEIAVKEGGTTAVMSSFNRIGTEWAGSSYDLLTEVLRNEWGFRGMVITDFNNGPGTYMDLDKMIRGGGDLNLYQMGWLSTSPKDLTPTQVTAMRNASKNILYTIANSNAMHNMVGRQLMPIWVVTMLIIFGAITAGLGVWGYFAIRKAYRKNSTKA